MTISGSGGAPLFNESNVDHTGGSIDFPDEYLPDNPYTEGYTPGEDAHVDNEAGMNQPVDSSPFDDVVIPSTPWGGDVDSSDGNGWTNV